jgi:uncharacterized protein (DUF952 family)
MIVHLCERTAWDVALSQGSYQAVSLEKEGFIHASRPEQALATANRFFRGQSGLVVLWIDPQRLKAPLRLEAADGDTFPHIYGPLNLDAVVAVSPIEADGDGIFRRLPGI